MEPQHEQSLKSILKKSEKEFAKWVDTLSDEELTYLEFLLEKADGALDEILLEQYGLAGAEVVIKKIMKKGVQ